MGSESATGVAKNRAIEASSSTSSSATTIERFWRRAISVRSQPSVRHCCYYRVTPTG